MKERWIMKHISVSSNGAKEIVYDFDPDSEEVTLDELEAVARFLNEYIEQEKKGGEQ